MLSYHIKNVITNLGGVRIIEIVKIKSHEGDWVAAYIDIRNLPMKA